ncbi:MAG: DUF2027 domain-containing protein [Bacteroidetes bacterium]|nr:DUF2027 domain-containing protein [Bacteroidota bacterium]
MANIKNFKVGDRVSFLNEKGGGIITKIVNDLVVNVAIEDGFEIPTAVSDLIKIRSEDPNEPALIRRETFIDDSDNNDSKPLYISHNDKDQLEEGIYVFMIPEIEETPLVGNIDIMLVNHTKYNALFSLFLNNGGQFQGEDYGFVEAESFINLSTIGRSDINSWANSVIQAVFFMEGKATPVKPISGFINFKPIKLYKEESFKFEKLLRKKAFVVNIGKLTDFQAAMIDDERLVSVEQTKALQEKLNEGTMQKEKAQKAESFLDKHKIDDKIAEIDLHIGELIENFNNLSNVDMLNIQMDYFRKSIHQAEVEKMHKLIFIHGVGNGVMKNEIRKYLRNTDGVEFHDASFARYGMGATEVVFYRNNK